LIPLDRLEDGMEVKIETMPRKVPTPILAITLEISTFEQNQTFQIFSKPGILTG
jgi:hypothetical protein